MRRSHGPENGYLSRTVIVKMHNMLKLTKTERHQREILVNAILTLSLSASALMSPKVLHLFIGLLLSISN